MSITVVDLALVVPLGFLCAITLVRNWTHGSLSIWSPLSLIAALYLYYTVIGPLYFIASGTTDFLGVEYGHLFWKGWLASLISYVLVVAGYLSYQGSKQKIGRVCSDQLLQRFALILFGISAVAILYGLASSNDLGSAFNPLEGSDSGGFETSQLTTFRFAGFWVNLINLSIAAVTLSFLVWLDKRSTTILVITIVALLFSVAYFLRTGFRFRIVWLTVAMMAAYYIWQRKKPNPFLLMIGALVFIALMGLIGMTRNYYGGLNLKKTQGAEISEYIDKGFSEAGIFYSLCSVMETVPDKLPYTRWDPLWITVTLPVPRMLWAEKPKSETLATIGRSFGVKGGEEAGQSIPIYGEWYVAWGWPGLIISSFAFGWISKRLWVWFLRRREDKLVILTYTVTLGYLYFVFSRGYTPLMVMNFIFGLAPFFLFYGWLRRRAFMARMQAVLGMLREQERKQRRDALLIAHPRARKPGEGN